VLIVLLVAVNVALLVAAVHLRHGKSAPPSASAFHSPRPQPTKTSSPPPSVTSATKSPAPLLSQANPTYALNAVAGCKPHAHLAALINNGVTPIGLTPPAAHILEISVQSTKRAWLVGADRHCHPTYYSTKDSGQTWAAAKSLKHVWVPIDRGVQNPSGKLTRPCQTGPSQPIAFASASSSRAIVICRRGVYRTTTAGRQWTLVGSLPAGRPVNLELRSNDHGTMLLKGLGACPGLRVAQTNNLGSTWSVGDCLNNVRAPAAVSIDPHGNGLVAGVGQRYHTTDNGRNWT
jgi:photosystem II stability/assembly factor-like uncharacterized protein